MKFKFHLLIVCLFLSMYSFTQSEALKPLAIGERMSDYTFDNLINYPSDKLHLSDFGDKLIILDFWSTTCTVCIQQFPKLDSLQYHFGDKVSIITVGFDANKKGSIQEFVKRRKGTKWELKLPTIVQAPSDSLLMKLFPFESLPHEVWIKNGKVLAITGHLEVNKENISALSAGKEINLKKRNLRTEISPCKPFLIPISANEGERCYGSLFSGFNYSLITYTPFGLQCDSSVKRLFSVNQSVFTLYKQAYRRTFLNTAKNKRMVIESPGQGFYKDWIDLKGDSDSEMREFEKSSLFCYDLILPPLTSLNKMYSKMIQDLDEYFSIESKLEQRKIKCLRLVRVSSEDKINAKRGHTLAPFPEDKSLLSAINMTMSSFVDQLNNWTNELVIDATEFKDLVSIQLRFSKNVNLEEINRQLVQYDLNLVPEEREMEVLVLINKK